jgi:hypothetical protein
MLNWGMDQVKRLCGKDAIGQAKFVGSISSGHCLAEGSIMEL